MVFQFWIYTWGQNDPQMKALLNALFTAVITFFSKEIMFFFINPTDFYHFKRYFFLVDTHTRLNAPSTHQTVYLFIVVCRPECLKNLIKEKYALSISFWQEKPSLDLTCFRLFCMRNKLLTKQSWIVLFIFSQILETFISTQFHIPM